MNEHFSGGKFIVGGLLAGEVAILITMMTMEPLDDLLIFTGVCFGIALIFQLEILQNALRGHEMLNPRIHRQTALVSWLFGVFIPLFGGYLPWLYWLDWKLASAAVVSFAAYAVFGFFGIIEDLDTKKRNFDKGEEYVKGVQDKES